MSGLTINLHKSENFLFGEAVNRSPIYQEIFTCELGVVPLKYLGMPASDIRIRNIHWKGVTEKIEKRCACWQGRLLNITGRVTLVQSYLTNIPLFMMSQYPIPVGIRKKADFIGQGLCGKLTWIKRNTIWLIGKLVLCQNNKGLWGF
jgi:hypothetical protein